MFAENPLWNELDAVKNKQVYFLDKHLYNLKPNARWAEAYETLAEIYFLPRAPRPPQKDELTELEKSRLFQGRDWLSQSAHS
mgnify:CR=1 FL=1